MGLDALEGTVILPLVIYDPPPLIQYVQPPSHVAPTTCNEKVSDPFEGTTGFGRMGTRRALLFKALSIFVLVAFFTNVFSIDPCTVYTDCSTCIVDEDCGFSTEYEICLTGDEAGPLMEETSTWFFSECPEELLLEEEAELKVRSKNGHKNGVRTGVLPSNNGHKNGQKNGVRTGVLPSNNGHKNGQKNGVRTGVLPSNNGRHNKNGVRTGVLPSNRGHKNGNRP